MEFGEQFTAPMLLVTASPQSSSSLATPTATLRELSLEERGATGGSLHPSCSHSSRGSAGFPAPSHPGFQLHSLTSGHPEFGSLGFPSLAAHSQYQTHEDWWQESEKHAEGTAAFSPPPLNLHPAIASNLKSYDPSHLQSSAVSGTMTDRSASPTGSSAATTDASDANSNHSQPNGRDLCQQRQSDPHKTQQKIPSKSLSGSSQPGSSSDGASCVEEISSDIEYMDFEDGYGEAAADQGNDTEESERNYAQNTPFKRQGPHGDVLSFAAPSEGDTAVGGNRSATTDPLARSRHDTLSSLQHSPRSPTQRLTQTTSKNTTPSATGDANVPYAPNLPFPAGKHVSVIHATGSAAGKSPTSTTWPSGFSPKLVSPPSPHSPPPEFNSNRFSPVPLITSLTPFSISSLTEPSTSFASPRLQHRVPTLTPPSQKGDGVADGWQLLLSSFAMQPIHSYNSAKQSFTGSRPSQNCIDTKLFPVHHPNGRIPTAAQDAPLALTTTTHSQSSSSKRGAQVATAELTSPSRPMRTHSGEMLDNYGSLLRTSASLDVTLTSRKRPAPESPKKSPVRSNLEGLLGASAPGIEPGNHRWGDSDESGEEHGDDDDDNLQEESSGSSLSDSDSNTDSDSDGSENDMKEDEVMELGSDPEKTPWSLNKAPLSSFKLPSNLPSRSSLPFQLNANSLSSPESPCGTTAGFSSSGIVSRGKVPLPSVSSTGGAAKRRKITDETILQLPLEFGWRRETRIRPLAGRQGEVAYFAPCGKKLRQYPDVMKYLLRNGITEISRDNFSYSMKVKVGDFYEAREGPEGLQWVQLAEDEIAAAIVAMDGRRSRCAKTEHQGVPVGDGHTQDANNAKLLRKLEAKEIARQAAQLKLMRKLEKQAMLQAAKEARRQQAIMAAEEKRKKREQVKLEKEQEKIKRIQQIRMERELRAQQILQERKRKREEAASAKLLENEKRNKEREMRRLQAVILKKQDLEKHRLDMERERRKQHTMLLKAVEARKRAEEKERVRREKSNERHLSKMRRLELRRLELEVAKQLKKPNEDMCLADHKPLPEISRIPGVILPPATFSDCLMVLQFLHSFGKTLHLEIDARLLNPKDLQEGLLNIGENAGRLQDMLVSMLAVAVNDPGMPAGHKSKSLLGDSMTSVHINRDNVSEILQLYISAHCEHTDLAPLALSLETKAFQAHSPSQKASILAFLTNELCSSKAVTSEIDKNIEHMTNLRKDKMVVDKDLRTLRSIHAKKTGKKDSSLRREDGGNSAAPAARTKCKKKEGDSDEDEDEEDYSEDQRDDDEEEEEEEPAAKRQKKADTCEEEDNRAQSATVEELEKLIEKTYKQQSQIKQKLFDSSQLLRSTAIGQDRYRRHYWVLPRCGGILVEGMESCEGPEERERKRQVTEPVGVGGSEWGEEKTPLIGSPVAEISDDQTAVLERHHDGDSPDLFLQKPFAASPGLDHFSPNVLIATPTPPLTNNAPPSSPAGRSPWMICSPQSFLQEEQFSKMMAEGSNQWFSVLPRSPCDDESVTSCSSPADSASSPVPVITSSSSALTYGQFGTVAPPGIKSTHLPISQQIDSDPDQSGLATCERPVAATSPALPSSGASPAAEHSVTSQQVEGDVCGVVLSANATIKSETQEPPNDTPPCASALAADVARVHDYPGPRPIPPEMLCGWWRMSKPEEVQSLISAFHSRGIREKVLQKQIQKHLEYIEEVSEDSMDDIFSLGSEEVSKKTMDSWCVEEQAKEVDIGMLQQVEALERKVVSAGLQVKNWIHASPQSKRHDLVYHEQKLLSLASPDGERPNECEQEPPQSVVRHPNNPLDIAVNRLAELQWNIEQRAEEGAAGMTSWHEALAEVRSSAQLSLCIEQLQKSINWERSISKLLCHFCKKGNKEELLLLCDGCDTGYHTYCHKPKISTVPDGEWFCADCECQRSIESPRGGRQPSRAAAAAAKKGIEQKRNNCRPPAKAELAGKQGAAYSKHMPKKGAKELRAQRGDNGAVISHGGQKSLVCSANAAKAEKESDTNRLCQVMLDELEAHRDAWPFLTPVNNKVVPGYKKIIKKPMDFSTIRDKLTNNQYPTLDSFVVDVNLVFENCEKFNEDDSEIGQAGHNMKNFFNKRRAKWLC